ncbi:MAG: hypothetical protein AAB909_01765, partial [Patescibacteria group bacterium]
MPRPITPETSADGIRSGVHPMTNAHIYVQGQPNQHVSDVEQIVLGELIKNDDVIYSQSEVWMLKTFVQARRLLRVGWRYGLSLGTVGALVAATYIYREPLADAALETWENVTRKAEPAVELDEARQELLRWSQIEGTLVYGVEKGGHVVEDYELSFPVHTLRLKLQGASDGDVTFFADKRYFRDVPDGRSLLGIKVGEELIRFGDDNVAVSDAGPSIGFDQMMLMSVSDAKLSALASVVTDVELRIPDYSELYAVFPGGVIKRISVEDLNSGVAERGLMIVDAKGDVVGMTGFESPEVFWFGGEHEEVLRTLASANWKILHGDEQPVVSTPVPEVLPTETSVPLPTETPVPAIMEVVSSEELQRRLNEALAVINKSVVTVRYGYFD